MKAIAFDREQNGALVLPPAVTLISDSAITGPSRPVFLPDFDSQWIAEFYMAVKICRLGKDIAEKFAPRYFDSLTVAMRLMPVGILEDLRRALLPCSATAMFDNALTPGKWIGLPDPDSRLDIAVNDMSVSFSGWYKMACESVAAVSRYATLKTGDIIMPCRVVPSINVDRGSMVRVAMGDEECMALKIH